MASPIIIIIIYMYIYIYIYIYISVKPVKTSSKGVQFREKT